jgi:hypothetical protein
MFLKLDGSEMHSFTSVADASEGLGISASYISTCLNNTENPVCKGYIVFRTKDAPMYIGKIMHYFNSNASDATKYQRIKAEEEAARKAEEARLAAIRKEEERRLEEERKAREAHANAVAKAEKNVDKWAARAIKYRRSCVLEPMNPYERRIIHTAVQEIEGVSSHSVGEGENRRVVIVSDNCDNSKRGGNYSKDRRGNGRRERRPQYVPETPKEPREQKVDAAASSRYGKIEPKNVQGE